MNEISRALEREVAESRAKTRKGSHWTASEDDWLRRLRLEGKSISQCADILGRSMTATSNRASRIRAIAKRKWTQSEIDAIRRAYGEAETNEDLNVPLLAKTLGRSEDAITIKAGKLGLTNGSRRGVRKRRDAPKYNSPEELKRAQSKAAKERIEKNGHPRGMLGKKHTEAAKAKMSESTKAGIADVDKNTRRQRTEKALKTKVQKYGSANPSRSRGSWKAGWRDVGGRRIYFRSRWEANYARYLEWLKDKGQIARWEHEPETFWFEKIKRGVRSYLPDFRVWESDGSSCLHEVKGWMDSRSRTTLKRMAKYHPDQTIVLIREKEMREIARKVAPDDRDWETR